MYVKQTSPPSATDIEEATDIMHAGLAKHGSQATDVTHCRFIDYARSIGICVPFMGLDPIAEGWAALAE